MWYKLIFPGIHCWLQSMKTYQQYHNEHLQAENKMRHVESQRVKSEKQQSGVTAAKTALSRRFRNYEKESEKARNTASVFTEFVYATRLLLNLLFSLSITISSRAQFFFKLRSSFTESFEDLILVYIMKWTPFQVCFCFNLCVFKRQRVIFVSSSVEVSVLCIQLWPLTYDLLSFLQKQVKFVESGLKAVKSRNEYILCLEAANAAMQKYFSDDVHELVSVSKDIQRNQSCVLKHNQLLYWFQMSWLHAAWFGLEFSFWLFHIMSSS